MALLHSAAARSESDQLDPDRDHAQVVPIGFQPEDNQHENGKGRNRVEFELTTVEESARDIDISVCSDGDSGADSGQSQGQGQTSSRPRGSVLKTAGRSTTLVCAFMQFLLMADNEFDADRGGADNDNHSPRTGSRTSTGAAAPRKRTEPTAYHFQQFHMALQYWKKMPKKGPAAASKGDDGDFLRFMSANASDWIPVTPTFLQRSFAKAVVYYSLLMLTLPVWVLLTLHDESSAHGRCVAHLLQVWSEVLMRRSWPLSAIHRFVANVAVRIACATALCALYASFVMCVFLRFPGGFMPNVYPNEASSDAFFPLVFAVLTGLLIGIQAAATLDFTSFSASATEGEPPAEHRRAVRASMAAVAHSHSSNETLTDKCLAWLYTVPTEKEKEQRELEESRSVLQQHHPLASPWLRSPAPLLLSVFAEVQHPDYRWWSKSSLCFSLLSVLVATYPNFVSLAAGGTFLGSCDPSRRVGGCVYGTAGIRFGSVMRIALMLGQTYLVAFLLHICYNYFHQKTIVRSKLFAILRRLLAVEETVQVQRQAQQQTHERSRFNSSSRNDSFKGSISVQGSSSISLGACSSAPVVGGCVATDLSLWWHLWRFTDRFDEREGWKVQCSLASFLGVMLLALAYVLLAWAQSWSGVDLTVLIIAAMAIIGLVGSYVLYILHCGIQINQLPADIDALLREAECEYQLAASILQQARAFEQRVPDGRSPDSLESPSVLSVLPPLILSFRRMFSHRVLSNPFTVLYVPLNTATINAAGTAILAAAASSVAAATQQLTSK